MRILLKHTRTGELLVKEKEKGKSHDQLKALFIATAGILDHTLKDRDGLNEALDEMKALMNDLIEKAWEEMDK